MAKCPNCKNQLTFDNIIIEERGAGFFRQETMYICPYCDVIISISRGKYF